jgi:hypothetical protein
VPQPTPDMNAPIHRASSVQGARVLSGPGARALGVLREFDASSLRYTPEELTSLLRIVSVGAIIVVLAGVALGLRVSTDRLTKDIRRHEHLADRAAGTWEQLQLDVAARRAPEHLEAAALVMGLQPAARVELVGGQP